MTIRRRRVQREVSARRSTLDQIVILPSPICRPLNAFAVMYTGSKKERVRGRDCTVLLARPVKVWFGFAIIVRRPSCTNHSHVSRALCVAPGSHLCACGLSSSELKKFQSNRRQAGWVLRSCRARMPTAVNVLLNQTLMMVYCYRRVSRTASSVVCSSPT